MGVILYNFSDDVVFLRANEDKLLLLFSPIVFPLVVLVTIVDYLFVVDKDDNKD